jgi:hypothetical protein
LRTKLWLREELRLRIELLQFVQQLLPTSLLLERSLRSGSRHVLLPQQLLLRSQLWL